MRITSLWEGEEVITSQDFYMLMHLASKEAKQSDKFEKYWSDLSSRLYKLVDELQRHENTPMSFINIAIELDIKKPHPLLDCGIL